LGVYASISSSHSRIHFHSPRSRGVYRHDHVAAPTSAEIDQWIARYKATGAEYAKVFLNLVAEETKVIETFDSSGRLDKRHEIVADLLVYQPSHNSGEFELRRVTVVERDPSERAIPAEKSVDGSQR